MNEKKSTLSMNYEAECERLRKRNGLQRIKAL